jgi:MFS family permease
MGGARCSYCREHLHLGHHQCKHHSSWVSISRKLTGVKVYAVYLAHFIADNTFPEATRLQLAFVAGLQVSISMAIGPLINKLVRTTSMRTSMAMGVVLQAGCLIACSFVTKVWQLFLAQGVGFSIAHGLLFTASAGVVSQWFTKRRSFANGLLTAGGGLGGLIFSLSVERTIVTAGMPWAYRMTAIVCFVVNSIATCLVRDRNSEIKANQKSFDLELFKRWDFRILLMWGITQLLGYTAILFSIGDYSRAIGLTSQQASIVAACLSLGMVFGRPSVGFFSDIYGRINVSLLCGFATGLTIIALWVPADYGNQTAKYGLSILFALLAGAICASFWVTMTPVTVEVVGLKNMNAALSIVWFSTCIPTCFSTPIALQLRGTVGVDPHPYLKPQMFSFTMYMVSTFCLWNVRAMTLKARKLREAEKYRQMEKHETYTPTGSDTGSIEPKFGIWDLYFKWEKV